ncbi:MAG: hypothetical protein GX121_06490 [Ignavibacteria bacterium]|nr:hypothetical protein [Ignavibacteria bacterium]
MQYRVLLKSLLFALLILFTSCIEENPNLVNPPPQTESVRVRFLNYASDGLARRLFVSEEVKTTTTSVGEISPAVMPDLDSSFAHIELDGQQEYVTARKMRYTRATNYTMIGLPSPDNSPDYKPLDSIIVLTTLTIYEVEKNISYLKVFNAIPDTTSTYTLTLGCPNGEAIAGGLAYRGVSPGIELKYGAYAVSLIKNAMGKQEILGLYSIDLIDQMQYCLIIKRSNEGKEEIWLLDELNSTTTNLSKANELPQRVTSIRAVNFSSSSVSIKKEDEFVANGLQSNRISSYSDLSACETNYQDTLKIFIGSEEKSNASASLEVLEKYTAFVFDSDSSKASFTILAEPFKLYENLTGKAIVRVINFAYNLPGLTFSLGARDNSSAPLAYSSGEVLASALESGLISHPILIQAGMLPLTIFTSTQPAKYIFGANYELEAGKSYVIAFFHNSAGENKCTIIEESEENSDVKFLEEASFVDIVHLYPGSQFAEISIPSLLSSVKIDFTTSLATVVPVGINQVTINDKTVEFNAQVKNRNLLIAAGSKEELEILTIITKPMAATQDNYKRRFINACKEHPSISVRIDCDTCSLVADGVLYGRETAPETVGRERKISLFFIDAEENKLLQRLADLSLALGKNYSIIFGAGEKAKEYSIVVQQEF